MRDTRAAYLVDSERVPPSSGLPESSKVSSKITMVDQASVVPSDQVSITVPVRPQLKPLWPYSPRCIRLEHKVILCPLQSSFLSHVGLARSGRKRGGRWLRQRGHSELQKIHASRSCRGSNIPQSTPAPPRQQLQSTFDFPPATLAFSEISGCIPMWWKLPANA